MSDARGAGEDGVSDDASREREFNECEEGAWGWDGYHVEDAVSFARMFKRQRDDLRARLATPASVGETTGIAKEAFLRIAAESDLIALRNMYYSASVDSMEFGDALDRAVNEIRARRALATPASAPVGERTDAERFVWLGMHLAGTKWADCLETLRPHDAEGEYTEKYVGGPDSLRAAIDAAMDSVPVPERRDEEEGG